MFHANGSNSNNPQLQAFHVKPRLSLTSTTNVSRETFVGRTQLGAQNQRLPEWTGGPRPLRSEAPPRCRGINFWMFHVKHPEGTILNPNPLKSLN
jgi:hypothetical protein